MLGDRVVQSLAKNVDLKRATQLDIRGPIVDNTSWHELLMKPNPFLRKRKWNCR